MLEAVSGKLLATVGVILAITQGSPARHTIAGRLQDSQGRVPGGVGVVLCRLHDNGSGCGPALPLAADGSFRTAPIEDATYVLVASPAPDSSDRSAAIERGLEIVTVAGRDISGVTVRTSRYSLRGRYVMRSDDPSAKWPSHLHVVASLVIGDRAYLVGESGSTGAPDGGFLLESVLGRRIPRVGYSAERGASWHPWQVLLDGVDITDTPTDFSRRPNRRLEYVCTQHPARITGRVVDANGKGVPGAWVTLLSADRALWTDWASTTEKTQAVASGAFNFAVRPGRYLVAALPPTPYQIRTVWPSFADLARNAREVSVADRARAAVVVTLR